MALAGDVLRKKLQAQKAGADGGPGADRAWRLAFARAVRDMLDAPVDFTSLSMARYSLVEVLELLPDRALIFMLEGPEEGLGLMILSPEIFSAMVEVLTMGRCGTQPPDPRRPTRTDSAMLAPLADLALANLEEALAEEGDLVWTSGFRFASFIEEARPLGLLLEEMPYRVVQATASLAAGARSGEILLILPAEGKGRKPRAKANAIPDAVARPAFAAALSQRVDAAEVQIDAVVARLRMPLAETMRLAVDMVLPLPNAALDQISFEGMDGRNVAIGRLGQHRGMRAVRLTSDPSRAAASTSPSVADWGTTGTASHRTSPEAVDISQGRTDDVAFAPETVEMEPFDFAAFPATGTE